MAHLVDENGFFGIYGGSYVPEMLRPNIEELQHAFKECISDHLFIQEFKQLLADYVGRPTPLYYAQRLSQEVGANIYLKREDLNHTGAHKINNAVGQILVAKKLGKKRIIAETGAGQHGVATATVCALMGIDCTVYMGEIDMARQRPNVERMKMLGAKVYPVVSGSKVLKDATNEALRDWIANPSDTYYLIGSVVGPHPFPSMVAYFQSVISEEIKQQIDHIDYVIACVGGGSNAMGAFYHFLENKNVNLIGVEAAGAGLTSGKTAATIALGSIGILHGCKSLLLQNEDGQILEAHSISAGLDYPGIGPQHAHLHHQKRVTFASVTDKEAIAAGKLLTRIEGILPALETSHAIAYLQKLDISSEKNIVLCLSGRGDKDLHTYLQGE
ncbi:tryptophan synthase subunit beta [Candidatus Uabimicrobium sp. HlEnr_7]|uniref:tryptophan synthase subunit beta n=1 Tax=Candidatus Uabimicrobium helgolandensis TaxID=3095367 RepID=UPI003557B67E